MNAAVFMKWIKTKFPALSFKFTEFDSGAFIVDFEMNHGRYCIEYFPNVMIFGLSKVGQDSPFFEGVDEQFATLADLELRIFELSK